MTTSHRFPPAPSTPLQAPSPTGIPAPPAGPQPQAAPAQPAYPPQAVQQPFPRLSLDDAPPPNRLPTGAVPGVVSPASAPALAAPLPQVAPTHTEAANDAVVLTHDLTKTFGKRTVVEGLNLVVPRGAVYGFLGPNGSGKSTTMKMLLGLLAPTRGQISVLGQPFTPSTRGQIISRTTDRKSVV